LTHLTVETKTLYHKRHNEMIMQGRDEIIDLVQS
jgi:hypothetical protein